MRVLGGGLTFATVLLLRCFLERIKTRTPFTNKSNFPSLIPSVQVISSRQINEGIITDVFIHIIADFRIMVMARGLT